MVLQGMGMSWLPKAMVVEQLESGEMMQMPGIPSLEMKIMLYRHKVSNSLDIDLVWENLSAG